MLLPRPKGTGTVTTVSVATANGVSGSVANATTTPALTLTLGAITPSSVTASGDIKAGTTGKGLYVKQGTNATFGQATLVGGTAVVLTNKVTDSSAIFITLHTLGGISVPAAVEPTTRSAGVSFTITSANVLDTSAYDWIIIEPA